METKAGDGLADWVIVVVVIAVVIVLIVVAAAAFRWTKRNKARRPSLSAPMPVSVMVDRKDAAAADPAQVELESKA